MLNTFSAFRAIFTSWIWIFCADPHRCFFHADTMLKPFWIPYLTMDWLIGGGWSLAGQKRLAVSCQQDSLVAGWGAATTLLHIIMATFQWCWAKILVRLRILQSRILVSGSGAFLVRIPGSSLGFHRKLSYEKNCLLWKSDIESPVGWSVWPDTEISTYYMNTLNSHVPYPAGLRKKPY